MCVLGGGVWVGGFSGVWVVGGLRMSVYVTTIILCYTGILLQSSMMPIKIL